MKKAKSPREIEIEIKMLKRSAEKAKDLAWKTNVNNIYVGQYRSSKNAPEAIMIINEIKGDNSSDKIYYSYKNDLSVIVWTTRERIIRETIPTGEDLDKKEGNDEIINTTHERVKETTKEINNDDDNWNIINTHDKEAKSIPLAEKCETKPEDCVTYEQLLNSEDEVKIDYSYLIGQIRKWKHNNLQKFRIIDIETRDNTIHAKHQYLNDNNFAWNPVEYILSHTEFIIYSDEKNWINPTPSKESDHINTQDALKLVSDSLDKKEMINHPTHYQSSKFEVIEVIEEFNLGFNLGNTVKYILRAGKKFEDKTLEDLKKARWYLDREIKNREQQI